jgi:hypothetical protein
MVTGGSFDGGKSNVYVMVTGCPPIGFGKEHFLTNATRQVSIAALLIVEDFSSDATTWPWAPMEKRTVILPSTPGWLASSAWHGCSSSWHRRITRRGISLSGPLYRGALPGMRSGRLRASTWRSMLASRGTAAPSLGTLGTAVPLEQPTKDVTEATTIAMIRMSGDCSKALPPAPPISATAWSVERLAVQRRARRTSGSLMLLRFLCGGIVNGLLGADVSRRHLNRTTLMQEYERKFGK